MKNDLHQRSLAIARLEVDEARRRLEMARRNKKGTVSLRRDLEYAELRAIKISDVITHGMPRWHRRR